MFLIFEEFYKQMRQKNRFNNIYICQKCVYKAILYAIQTCLYSTCIYGRSIAEYWNFIYVGGIDVCGFFPYYCNAERDQKH